jgi:hypothetical protein
MAENPRQRLIYVKIWHHELPRLLPQKWCNPDHRRGAAMGGSSLHRLMLLNLSGVA